jgi:hypothetical protein
MRYLCLVPVLVLAACGGDSGNKAKSANTALQPGQYEVTAEVTQFRKADQGTPKVDTPVGTRTTRSVCLAGTIDTAPDLFSDEGFVCQMNSGAYARNGILNLTTSCSKTGLEGQLGYSISGSYDAQSFQADRTMTTALSTDGDVVIASRIQGRRTGECSAAPAAPAAGNKQ